MGKPTPNIPSPFSRYRIICIAASWLALVIIFRTHTTNFPQSWHKTSPSFARSDVNVMMVTGSQPLACTHPAGDHFLLRFFKNKVDYARVHKYQIFYHNAYLHPKMRGYWAKAPILRAAMAAHPEVEWLFWVDSDAAFTDMDFRIPFERYKDHNLVIHGWPQLMYEARSWLSLNSGVFLLRNCQWSVDFLDAWARMSPMSPDYDEWGVKLNATLRDMMVPVADDQSALVYLILEGEKKWRELTYVENEYDLSGYWADVVGKYGDEGRRPPFTTHFTGCQPCSGGNNPAYEGDSCRVGMERALKFADNQVLRKYGFVRREINGSAGVTPL